jgi:hypothetical protein
MPAEIAEVIALPFTAYVAPVGTAFPAITAEPEAFASAWKVVGKSGDKNYSEAGVTVTHTQTHGQFVSAGGIVPRKKWRTEEAMTVAFELVDLSPKSYAQIMDEAAVTKEGSVQKFDVKRGIKIHFYALLLRGTSTLNEAKNAQYQVSACCMNGNPAPKFSLKQGPAMLAVQFDVLEIEEGKWAEFVAEE